MTLLIFLAFCSASTFSCIDVFKARLVSEFVCCNALSSCCTLMYFFSVCCKLVRKLFKSLSIWDLRSSNLETSFFRELFSIFLLFKSFSITFISVLILAILAPIDRFSCSMACSSFSFKFLYSNLDISLALCRDSRRDLISFFISVFILLEVDNSCSNFSFFVCINIWFFFKLAFVESRSLVSSFIILFNL